MRHTITVETTQCASCGCEMHSDAFVRDALGLKDWQVGILRVGWIGPPTCIKCHRESGGWFIGDYWTGADTLWPWPWEV